MIIACPQNHLFHDPRDVISRSQMAVREDGRSRLAITGSIFMTQNVSEHDSYVCYRIVMILPYYDDLKGSFLPNMYYSMIFI